MTGNLLEPGGALWGHDTMTERLLSQMERQAAEGGLDDSLCVELERVALPSDIAAPRMLAALDRTNVITRFALGTIALCLSDDPGYRPVVETVIRHGGLRSVFKSSLVSRYEDLRTDDALGWLFDLLVGTTDYQGYATRLVYYRLDALQRCRGESVRRFVFDIEQGPEGLATDAAIEAVRAGAPVRLLEEQWGQWIEMGDFDGGISYLPSGRSSASWLVRILARLAPVDGGGAPGLVAARERLADAAVNHWNGLLLSSDAVQAASGMTTLAALLLEKSTCFGRFPSGLPSTLPCEPKMQRAVFNSFLCVARIESGRGTEVDQDQVRSTWEAVVDQLTPNRVGRAESL